MELQRSVGQRIVEARQQQRWSQVDLAVSAGVGIATLKRIELGQYEPRLSTARRLAEALGVSLESIVSDRDGSPDRDSRDG